MLTNLRQTLRVLRKSPGFTTVAVLTLALGIGANTAMFSVIDALLLRSLALDNPARLVAISASRPDLGLTGGGFSVAAYENLRDGNRSFDGVAAFTGDGMSLVGRGDPEQLVAGRVSPNFLDVLGARPLKGRGFQPAEGETGGVPVVLLSYPLWKRRFAADTAILGKPITLNQEVYTVIGVMPPDFALPFGGIDVWISRVMNFSGFQPEQVRAGAGFLRSFARLRAGVSMEQADADVAILNQHYRQEHPRAPDADPHALMALLGLQESLVGGLRPTLLVLMGAVGLVLLIACANVASLMLARATGRAREIALRTALGAGRGMIVRQLLMEGSLLAASGAVLGAVLAQWGVVWLTRIDAGNTLPTFQPIRVDLRVLAFTLAVSLVAGMAFSLAPALQLSRPDLNGVLRDSGWGTTTGSRRHRTRALLVVGQMALSVVLLIGAGLLMESFRQLRAVNSGFNPHNALTMNVSLPPGKYADGSPRAQFFRLAVQRLAALPGVHSAVATFSRPMESNVLSPILADGQPNVLPAQRPLAIWDAVTPGYFETFGVPLLRGRDFTWADDEKAPRVVIVCDTLARRFWPNGDAIGKHLTFTRFQVPFEIVGVAGDTRNSGAQAAPGMVMFTPYPQWTFPAMELTLRTEGDPAGFARAATLTIQTLDKDLPITRLQSVDSLMEVQFNQPREILFLIGGFAALALLLALIGLYGVMAYSVAQRTTEIGIRQAIGAQRADILRMVFGQAARLCAVGIGAGIAGAVAVTRLMRGMLFHVSATDPVTYGAIALAFLAVAMLATYIPAWRATRVDPLEALRSR